MSLKNPTEQANPEFTDLQSDDSRREEEEMAAAGLGNHDAAFSKEKVEEEEVTWSSLPMKSQLAVLTLARLAEPLVQTSLQAYMFYMLKDMDGTLPDSVIATQAGILASTFTGAQCLTAMLWGKLADSEKVGRKMVIMIGLSGTMLSVLGFGFSKTFWQAALSRTLGGVLNGNIGVMRCAISELIQEKKYQSRAFLLFPMCFNIGVVVGPILGGLLADPAGSYPTLFGNVQWMKRFPYALPNLVSAALLFMALLGVFFGLDETLDSLRHKQDLGSKCGEKISQLFCGRHSSRNSHAYARISSESRDQNSFQDDVEMSSSPTIRTLKEERKWAVPRWKKKLEFRRIFTSNVLFTLLAHFLMATHLGTFNNLWFVFLSTPVSDPKNPIPPSFKQRLPFIFTGGLGMPPRDVGFAMAVLGILGIAMQLFIYPRVNARLGTVKSWRIFLCLFPIAYLLVPYLAIIPSQSPPPSKKDGILVWIALCGVLLIQVSGRTFALPATVILVNNACPHPSVLGTMHGIAQSLSSAGRAFGPMLGGSLYGVGLRHGVVGGVWWGLSGLALVNCFASRWVKEGDGHEIVLDGDVEAEAEFQAAHAESSSGSGDGGEGSSRESSLDRARTR